MTRYADLDDLARLGLKRLATAGIPDADLLAALDAASELADSYLRSQYMLPLLAWGSDLKRHVAMIAAWDVLSAQRGFNPDAPAEQMWLTRYEQAITWLKDVAKGLVNPNVQDSTPRFRDGAPRVHTQKKRGW